MSDRSGLGELLTKELGAAPAAKFLVRTSGNIESDAQEWARAMEVVLRDPHHAFKQTRDLCGQLSGKLTWEHAIGSLLSALATATAQLLAG